MSYKFTVVIVRPSQCMKLPFRGTPNLSCIEVATGLAVHAAKEDLLLGTPTRSRVAFAFGETMLKPTKYHEANFLDCITILEKQRDRFRLEQSLGFLQQMEITIKAIRDQIICKQKGDDVFKAAEYEFRIITCRDGPKTHEPRVMKQIKELLSSLHTKLKARVKVIMLEPTEYPDIKDSAVIDPEVQDLLESYPGTDYVKLHERMDELQGPYRKRIGHFCKYTGVFEITPYLRIPVKIFIKVSQNTHLSMKQYSKLSNLENRSVESGRIDRQRIHHEADDPDAVVLPHNTVRGLKYGADIVPIPQEIWTIISNSGKREEASLKLLHFAKVKKFKRHYLMGRGDVLVPQTKDKKDILALRTLIHAMVDESTMAVCALVTKKNTREFLYGLFPYADEGQSILLFGTELPTSEDIREFTFPRLKQASDEQLERMEDFIEANELPDDVLDPSTTFDPEKIKLLDCLFNRAVLKEENCDLGLPEYLFKKYFPPLPQDAGAPELQLANVFKLKEKEIKNAKKPQKRWWTDVLKQQEADLQANQEAADPEQVGEQQEGVMVKEKDEIAYPKFTTNQISFVKPLKDFEDMLNDRTEDLTERAIKQMQQVIVRTIDEGSPDDLVKKAVDCLTALRKACIKEDEFGLFNEFLRDLRHKYSPTLDRYKPLWQQLVKDAISLIGNAQCKVSNVTEEESDIFLEEVGKLCQVKSTEVGSLLQMADVLNDIE
jgi:hypothetical protein